MQVTIIGKFELSSKGEGVEVFRSADTWKSLVLFEDVRQAIEQFDAGLEADLVICGPEIDMALLLANFEMLGIPAPVMLQPDKSKETGKTGDHNQIPAEHQDASAWLGDENNPLRLGQRLADMEREAILQTLTHCGGNRTYAAEILGISARTMRNKLQQYAAEGCTVISPRFRQSAQEQVTHSAALLDS